MNSFEFPDWPVPSFVTVTLAVGITDPDGSVTVPTIVAFSCANTADALNKTRKKETKGLGANGTWFSPSGRL